MSAVRRCRRASPGSIITASLLGASLAAALLACGRDPAGPGVATPDSSLVAAADSAEARDSARSASPASSRLWIEMRNVIMHLDKRATIRVQQLRGEVLSTVPGEPAVLDDAGSFSIRVSRGTVGLTGDDLTTLLNRFVFAYDGAPLEDLRARADSGAVMLTGTMHKGVDLPFEIRSSIGLTPEGMIRLTPTRTRILGINGASLMNALGLELEDLLNLKGSRGASVHGDEIHLDPSKILPPPAIAGRVASARVAGERVVIEFTVTPTDSVFGGYVRPDTAYSNFVFFRGAQLKFGKLLMDDTDLLIADADQSDPFDLNLDEYAKQLVAGTSHTLPDLGLRVDMPDYASLAGGEVAPKRDQRRRP